MNRRSGGGRGERGDPCEELRGSGESVLSGIDQRRPGGDSDPELYEGDDECVGDSFSFFEAKASEDCFSHSARPKLLAESSRLISQAGPLAQSFAKSRVKQAAS